MTTDHRNHADTETHHQAKRDRAEQLAQGLAALDRAFAVLEEAIKTASDPDPRSN